MTIHWKAVLGVILIFVLGFTSGVVASSIFFHRKLVTFMEHPGVVVEAAFEKKLMRNLDLDENQKQQVHGIFMDNLQQRKDLNQQIQPQVRVLNAQTFQQINAVLRPDQQERFRENIEKFRNRFGKAAADADSDNFPPAAGPATNSAPPPVPPH